MPRRRLHLTRERLAELSADDLAGVHGAQAAPACTGTSHPFPTRDLRCIASLDPRATCVILS